MSMYCQQSWFTTCHKTKYTTDLYKAKITEKWATNIGLFPFMVLKTTVFV